MSGKTARRNRKTAKRQEQKSLFSECYDENGMLNPNSPSVISVWHPEYGDDEHAPFEADPSERVYADAVWAELSKADKRGVAEVRRVASMLWSCAMAAGDFHRLTHLVLVFNHKIWEHWEAGNHNLAKDYNAFWGYADEWCCDHLTGDARSYFFQYSQLIGTAMYVA